MSETGRVAKVRLTPEQLAKLQGGETLQIRLPKGVALLRISLREGDIFQQFDELFDRFWGDWGKLWDRVMRHRK